MPQVTFSKGETLGGLGAHKRAILEQYQTTQIELLMSNEDDMKTLPSSKYLLTASNILRKKSLL